MLLSLLIACSGGDAGYDYSSGDATAGATVYADTCAVCHGDDAHGIDGSGVDLEEPFTNDSDDDLADAIMNGYGDMAPNALTDEETADVIAYCHSLF